MTKETCLTSRLLSVRLALQIFSGVREYMKDRERHRARGSTATNSSKSHGFWSMNTQPAKEQAMTQTTEGARFYSLET